MSRSGWALLLIGILGLALRAHRLPESLWYDEIMMWGDYGSRGPAVILTTYHNPANHVAHTLVTWCSVTVLGDGLGVEIAMRLPALVCSLLSIAAMYALGARAAGRTTGLLVAGAAAAAPVAVLSGVEARGYGMMILFAAASAWQLLAAIDTRAARHWIAYGVLIALGIWSHPMTVFAAAGHAAWLAWRARRERRLDRAAIGLAVGAVLTLALYAPIIDDVVRSARDVGGTGGAGRSPFGPEGFHALLQIGGAWAWWAALPGLVLAAIGLMSARRNARTREVVAITLLGLPLMLAAVVVAGTWMYARFTLFALPGALFLVARGAPVIGERHRAAGAAATIAVVAAWGADLITRPPKQPLRDAASYVLERRAPADRILVVGLGHGVLHAYLAEAEPTYSLFHGNDLAAKLAETDPRWVIVIYPESVPPERYDLLTARGYHEIRRFDGWVDWTNGDVLIYERETRDSRAFP